MCVFFVFFSLFLFYCFFQGAFSLLGWPMWRRGGGAVPLFFRWVPVLFFFGPADGLVGDDALAFGEVEFAGEGGVVDEAADDGGESFGGGVEVDVLVGGADVAAAPFVVFGGVEEVDGGVFDEGLGVAVGDEVFVVDFLEGVGVGFVEPGAGGGEEVEGHVLLVARGGDGAFAGGVLAPCDPEDFAEGLVVYGAVFVVEAAGGAVVDGFHEGHAAGGVGCGELFGFCGGEGLAEGEEAGE